MRPASWLVAATFLTSAPPASPQELIVKHGTSVTTTEIVEALLAEAPSQPAPRVVDLSGNFAIDLAHVGRQAEGATTLFAIGPNAAVLASAVVRSRKTGRVIAVGVPNPERLDAVATYVSFYPELAPVIRFLVRQFEARVIGLVYSPRQNSAVAGSFRNAAESEGIHLLQIEAGSAGDLIRHLKTALTEVEVLLVPADPILFDRDLLRIVVDEAKAAQKPTVGFLPELARLGFTGALVVPRTALAKAAWEASRQPGTSASSTVVQVEGPLLYVSGTKSIVVQDVEKPGERKPHR